MAGEVASRKSNKAAAVIPTFEVVFTAPAEVGCPRITAPSQLSVACGGVRGVAVAVAGAKAAVSAGAVPDDISWVQVDDGVIKSPVRAFAVAAVAVLLA